MRVFHFVNAEFGLENLRRRRLKIATLHELNDPFELLGINLADESLRRAIGAMKNQMASTRGLLCFSRDWHNPVQWSHYAEKHTGICLGFDVPDEILSEVSYSRRRFVIQPECFRDSSKIDITTAKQVLFTKYSHWRYENEIRCFVTLEEKDTEKNMYFADFSDKLHLTTVIVGARSAITRADLQTALGELSKNVEAFKVRPAFKTFQIVRQCKQSLWR
ncbi:DUF2971 domain-containing protein [Nitrosospira sp. Nsp13]|uniref:DUF2971 domain-containing protein n=1 Tax=Nitrosospira sp. Nsp13 TaxID=1855332 RepID=UPI000881B1C3|nr:DUF2971 domain-containing protein [Nitrosospira sp. Nsp13]SCX76959.1 Protein of unknown function [Nitrosospira sp. Nsp13]